MPRNTGISRSPTQGGLYPSMVQDGLEALYLMEIERRNLLTHSEDFSRVWSKSAMPILASGLPDPLGGSTATRFDVSSNDPFVVQACRVTAGVTYTWSVWMKGEGDTVGRNVMLYAVGTSLGVLNENFSLSSEWQRFSLTFTATADENVNIRFDGPPLFTSVLAYGAQVNEGSTALPYVPTSNKRAVYDYSGKGNHAHLGSAGVAFINPVGGEKALNFPSNTRRSADYAKTPVSAEMSVTGDLDIRARLALPAGAGDVFGVPVGLGGAYTLYIGSGGKVRLAFKVSSTNHFNVGMAHGESPGAVRWIRATRTAATGVIEYLTSVDGVQWTSLGTSTDAAGPLDASSGDLQVGDTSLGPPELTAPLYRAQVYDGIDGTLVADFNAEDAHGDVTQFYSSTTGELWTINQGAATTNDPTWTGEGLDFDVTDDQVLNIPTFAGSEFAAEGGVWTTTPGAYETLGSFTSLLNAHGGYSRTLTSAEIAQNYRAVQHALSGRGVVI